jgi:glutamine amidotransferase
MIAIVDYGMGNVRSIFNALRYAGCEAVVTADHGKIRQADRVILPGVGAFGDAMSAIRERDLEDLLEAEVSRGGKPMLGICLGMQLLARSSTEHGAHTGLGWLDARVERLNVPPGFKVPHIGWNTLKFSPEEPLFRGLRPGELNFYFVHSFHMRCHDREDVIATCDYGEELTAAVRHGNVVATQFHPEKSQDNGIRVLQNFLDWKP